MNVSDKTISEEELQAYIDGQLDEHRRQAVERYLAEHPEQAEDVQYHQQLNQSLRETYDSQLREPIPGNLRLAAKRAAPPLRQRPWFAVAASVLLLVTGTATGWLLRAEQFAGPTTLTALANPAHVAHVVYTPEVLHPVEVDAGQDQHLFKWLSNRLGGKVRAPDLSPLGYRLMGGRLLPAEQKPAAQFMYENEAGTRLTLYIRSGFNENRETAFRYREEQGIGTFYWVDQPFGYAFSGALSRAELLHVANALYAELSL